MAHPEALNPARLVAARLAQVRRERLLPAHGSVHVSVGQEVEPRTLVAEGPGPNRVRVVEVGTVLGLAGQRLEGALLVRAGDVVQAGQPLAERKGRLRGRAVRAPVAGEVLAIGAGGSILLAGASERVQLLAGMRGRVISVTPDLGAVIEGSGAVFQGIWGNGREASAPLRLLARDRERAVEAGQIDDRSRGAIVVGGGTLNRDAIEAARAVEVQGVIAGSMPHDLVAVARALPFALMLTEGFDGIAMAAPLFEGVAHYDGQAAILDARFSAASGAAPPELFVTLGDAAQPLSEPRPLAEGQWVRLVADPLLGTVGRVARVEAGPQRCESGLMLAGCEVELDSGETVFVPYSNLEQIVPM
ncbi:MAG TPA: hypothetical protein VEQ85_02730 [Lacipirellulaceae bacterium]|nr:hypothetical protein [Lacipirellulaceae bacterium]